MSLMLLIALQVAPLVRYDELAQPNVRGCAAEYNRLQNFNARFKQITFNRELSRGGRLEWSDANNIRNTADVTVRPYMEALRQAAPEGNTRRCSAIASEGIRALTDQVIRPVFGRR